MSLTATRFSRSGYSAILSLEETLFEEGYIYDGNFLEEIERPATEEDLSYLREIFWNEGIRGQDLKKEIDSLPLTHGGEKLLHEAVRDHSSKPLANYVAKYHFTQKLSLWQSNDANSSNFAITQPLLECGYWNDSTEFKIEADLLWSYGIRWVEDAIKVYKIIPHVWTKGRSLNSLYQANFDQICLVATNTNYRNLPMWAKIQTIKGNHASSRPGDVWRSLMPALKAWKWDNSIPKRFAKRLGEMSPKYRALGAIAWELCQRKQSNFWEEFQLLCKNPEKAVKILLFGIPTDGYSYSFSSPYTRNRALEILWGLPHKFLDTDISPNTSDIGEEDAIQLLAKYSELAGVCRMLFGCGGKQVQKLFRSSAPDHRKWAIALAYSKEDLVQKYLGAECVPYQEDAVAFLKSLGEKPALRMVQTTTMTLRGKTQDVTSDYIRDTGYLFNQLQNAGVSPDLGRVRCWFSTHEVLAKEYVKILPDFELKINSDFAPLDGLSSLDMAWEIEIPRHQHQLKRYGEILSHCVGGYGGSINSSRSVIVAAYFQGVLKYTLEFTQSDRKYRCNQFYGFRNSSPSESDRTVILDMFQQAKLIN